MKKTIALLAALLCAGSLQAQTHVNGYYRSNGTYVAPHYRSSPNSSPYDNWSSRGNTNPYTGQVGTRDNDIQHYRSGQRQQSAWDQWGQ